MEHPCSPPVPSLDALARDRSVTRSLAARSDYVLIGASLIFGVAIAVALCAPELLPIALPFHVDLGEHRLPLALPIGVFPLLITLVGIGVVLTPSRKRQSLDWLARL